MKRRVLLVEDSPADWELVSRSMRSSMPEIALAIAGSGDEAMRALSPKDPAEQPELVLLDLNLPDIHGREVLRHIRGAANLAALPVVVLTTSDSQRDILECYRIGCNGYLIKPHSFREYSRLLAATCEYWLNVAALPRRSGARAMANDAS